MRYNNFKQNLGDEHILTINIVIYFQLLNNFNALLEKLIIFQQNVIIFSKLNSWNDDTFCYKVQSLNQACSVS